MKPVYMFDKDMKALPFNVKVKRHLSDETVEYVKESFPINKLKTMKRKSRPGLLARAISLRQPELASN